MQQMWWTSTLKITGIRMFNEERVVNRRISWQLVRTSGFQPEVTIPSPDLVTAVINYISTHKLSFVAGMPTYIHIDAD